MNLTKLNMSTYLYFGIGMLACSFVILYVNSFYLKIVFLTLIFLYLHLKINKCIRQSNRRSIFTQLSDDDEEYQDRKVLRNRSTSLDNKYIVYDRNGRKRCIRHDSVYDHTNSRSNLIDDDTSDSTSLECSNADEEYADYKERQVDICTDTELQDQKRTFMPKDTSQHRRKSSCSELTSRHYSGCSSASTQDTEESEANELTNALAEIDDEHDSSSSDQDSSCDEHDSSSSDQDSSCDEHDDSCDEQNGEASSMLKDETSVLEYSQYADKREQRASASEEKKIIDDTIISISSPKHEFERTSTYYLCQ